jgi:plastocyanin
VLLAWPSSSSAGASTVDVQDNRFVAPSITITAGDSVTWSVSGVGTHSVTADDGSFDSSPACPTSCLSHGSTFSHTFSIPGTYPYYCRIHGGPGGIGMSGAITVTAAQTATTEPATGTPIAPPPGGTATGEIGGSTRSSPTPLPGTPDLAG